MLTLRIVLGRHPFAPGSPPDIMGSMTQSQYANWSNDRGVYLRAYHDHRARVYRQTSAPRTDRSERWRVEIVWRDYPENSGGAGYPMFVERDGSGEQTDVLTAEEFSNQREAMLWAEGCMTGLSRAPVEQQSP